MNLIQNGGIYMKKFVNNNLYLFSLFFPLSLLCHPRALFLLCHPRAFFYYVILGLDPRIHSLLFFGFSEHVRE